MVKLSDLIREKDHLSQIVDVALLVCQVNQRANGGLYATQERSGDTGAAWRKPEPPLTTSR